MPAISLKPRKVEKPWGRTNLPPGFDPVRPGGARVGEIIFDSGERQPRDLLIKYLFTSDRLSVQVHPGDAAAQAGGLPNGKDEAWVVLDAEPNARLGLGLSSAATVGQLRQAALDGTIEAMVDWRPVHVGDCIYSPGGTIHAIGGGLVLIEVQQDSDVTYRLFDYGRPRDLHLEEALAVSDLASSPLPQLPFGLGGGRTRLVSGPAFQVERLDGPAEGWLTPEAETALWLLPLSGNGWLDGEPLAVGGCWLMPDRGCLRLESEGAVLLAYAGGETRQVWQANR